MCLLCQRAPGVGGRWGGRWGRTQPAAHMLRSQPQDWGQRAAGSQIPKCLLRSSWPSSPGTAGKTSPFRRGKAWCPLASRIRLCVVALRLKDSEPQVSKAPVLCSHHSPALFGSRCCGALTQQHGWRVKASPAPA